MAGNTVKEMTTNFGKLDKFEGHDFRRWQKKMHFLLTTLKVVYVLTTPMPELLEDATVEAIRRRAKWENDDYMRLGELWDSLESKYMAEDSSSKKFLVSNFNNYKMVDSRPVMEQYNELLRILGHIHNHGLKMDESISVSSIIDKLPPSWKDFKHTLKHGKDDLSLVQLGSHLRIEKSLRAQDSDKGKGKEVGGPSVNMTEEGLVHFKRDLACSGKKNNANAGGSGKKKGLKEPIPRTMGLTICVVDSSGATTHVCKDRCWFRLFETSGRRLYFSWVMTLLLYTWKEGALEFNSGKTVTLFTMLYVPKLRKNLALFHLKLQLLLTPQQNGVDERKNRSSYGEMVNSMYLTLGRSKAYGPERKTSGVYKLNVSNQEMQYLMDKNSVSLNTLDHKDFIPNLEESQRDDHSDDVPSETPEPRRGKRAKKAKSYGSDFQLYLVEGSRDQVGSNTHIAL
ncbi:hypothetical protein Tco_0282455 [Tanacetum coccineum]